MEYSSMDECEQKEEQPYHQPMGTRGFMYTVLRKCYMFSRQCDNKADTDGKFHF